MKVTHRVKVEVTEYYHTIHYPQGWLIQTSSKTYGDRRRVADPGADVEWRTKGGGPRMVVWWWSGGPSGV